MDSSFKVKKTKFVNKLMCMLGQHKYQVVEDYSLINNFKGVTYSSRQRCIHCGCDHDIVDTYSQWEGCEREIVKTWYVGNYHWRTLAEKAMVKLSGVFGSTM